MKHIVVSTLFTFFAAVASGAELRAVLEVTPQTLVVGLSPSVAVEVTNVSSRALPTPSAAALLASPLDGSEPFFANINHPVYYTSPLWNEDVPDLAPHQTVRLEFPATASILDPPWFSDPRFQKPGAWRLQVAFLPPGMQHADFEVQSTAALADQLRSSGRLSTPVTFTSTAPAGEDAAVCQLVSDRVGLPGCPIRGLVRYPDLVRRISHEYPKSSYFPYLVAAAEPSGDSVDGEVGRFERAIALVGNSRTVDWYRWILAEIHESGSFDNNGPPERAKRHEQQAHAIWNALTKSNVRALRLAAAKKLKEAAESKSED
jgi:hypothetical protein